MRKSCSKLKLHTLTAAALPSHKPKKEGRNTTWPQLYQIPTPNSPSRRNTCKLHPNCPSLNISKPVAVKHQNLFFSALAAAAAAAAKWLQLCSTLCDPIDGSPTGSPIPGTLQARTLEWVAISFSNAWKWKVKVKSLSRVRLFSTPWTAAYQVPPSIGFSRQEYWSGVPFPSPDTIL